MVQFNAIAHATQAMQQQAFFVVDVARNLNALELQLPFAIQTRFPVIALIQNRTMGQRGATARLNQQTELPLMVCFISLNRRPSVESQISTSVRRSRRRGTPDACHPDVCL